MFDELVIGDADTGKGLTEAFDGVEVAYYLIHSMEGPAADFAAAELRQAERFATAAALSACAGSSTSGESSHGTAPTPPPSSRRRTK